jgi:hypothetical protein
MKHLDFGRYALSGCAVVAMLAGCGGSQAALGGSGTSPQSRTVAGSAMSRSRISRTTGSSDLLYVSSANSGDVFVFSYPGLSQVGTLKSLNYSAQGECVDSAGDVFIATSNASYTGTIFEYAHGGSTPIAELSDPGYPWGCTVDSTTGTLAVSNLSDASNPSGPHFGDLAIYPEGQGLPTMYASADIAQLFFCGYDQQGNLYVDGQKASSSNASLFELTSGSGSLSEVTVNATIHEGGSVQWDGQYMTIADYNRTAKYGPELIYRLQISGDSAKVIGTTKLKSARNRHIGQSWIEGANAIGIVGEKRLRTEVGFWKYPGGGKDHHPLSAGTDLFGVTISRAN